MKKRLLSALLALALVFVLLPTTALAGETTGKDYDISINGKGYKFDSDGSNGYITAYYYGNSPSNYFFSTEAKDNWATNSNLKLTKEGNTVTITIRPRKAYPYESPNFTLKKESTEKNDVPCIEMGNDNNLVITGKGTLNITRNENKSYGAALYSNVGDITINGGITVNVSFLNGKDYYNKNVSSNAIYVGDNHNLTVSGSGTNVTATNQGFDSSPATVCVEGGTITVSGGASLSATNTYDDNRSGSDDVKTQHFNSYAISGTKSNPCTLIVADEKSSVTATTNDFTNIAESWAFKYTTIQAAGATIKAGSSVSNSTVTTIDNISGQRYAKISIPALQRTSDVLIAGEKAVVGQWTTITADSCSGSYYYDADKKELTLKDITITRNNNNNVNHAIQFTKNGDYTINLEGANNISSVANGICALNKAFYDDPANISVTISGSGSLNVIANNYAIDMQVGNLIFNNTGNITLTTNTNYTVQKTVCNALHVAGSITIDNTKYDIVGARQEKGYPTETISDSIAFAPDLLNGYTVGETTTLFKTITITPAAAKPSTISYDGTTLKQGETIKDGKGGTATVDSKNNTITLKNFNGTALSFDATLADSTLVLEGTNTLSSIVTTQKGLTISGSGSLTVGSIRVPNNTQHTANLTINGATVTVGTAELTTRAIDIDGDLTVTNGSLKATSKSDSVPTVQVGGNASFTGSTVTITNNSTELHKDAADATKGDSVSSALYVKGNINTDNAKVTAKVENGGGNAIGAVGNITVKGSSNVTAVNKGQKFTTIIAENVYVSGDSKITANNLNENPVYNGSYLAFPAIEGNIVNQNTDYSLKFEGQHNGTSVPKTTLAPGEQTTLYYYNVTITRGDEVTRTNSPVVIAGTTLLNDTHYTITNGSKVAEGTDSSNYNAFYDSETKTLKLNNASINGTGVKAIEANVGGYTFTIELVGNNIIKTSGSANNVIDITGNLYFTGSGTAEVSGKGTPIYATYKIDVSADVTITNTEKAGSFTFSAYGENSSNYKGANTFAIGTGYTAYATTDKTTWAVYDNTTASENESYTTLRITTQPPETGGGSTHQHTWDTTKWYDVGDGYHANKCTGCTEYDLTNKKAHVAWPDEDKGPEGHTEKCMLCDYKYDQSVIKPHEWTGWWVSDYQPEVHAQRCNCGYQGSTHRTLKYVAINSEQHQKQCPVDGCGYKIEYKTSHVYEEGSNICTECGYDKSAPCNHTGDRVYTNNGDGTHKVTCKACGATIVEKETHEFDPTGACVCGATQSGGNPTPDNPGTIVIIRPAEEEKPAQQPNPSTGANDLVGMAVAAAVVAVLGSVALLRKHD